MGFVSWGLRHQALCCRLLRGWDKNWNSYSVTIPKRRQSAFLWETAKKTLASFRLKGSDASRLTC
jgi:hypothetical protein